MNCPVCGYAMDFVDDVLVCKNESHATWSDEMGDYFGEVVIYMNEPEYYWFEGDKIKI